MRLRRLLTIRVYNSTLNGQKTGIYVWKDRGGWGQTVDTKFWRVLWGALKEDV